MYYSANKLTSRAMSFQAKSQYISDASEGPGMSAENVQNPKYLTCIIYLAPCKWDIAAGTYPKNTFTRIHDTWDNDRRLRASMVKVVRNPRYIMLLMVRDKYPGIRTNVQHHDHWHEPKESFRLK